jgi:rubrerythrin
VKEVPTPELRVSTTKNNLNHAATVEIEEIDDEYPRLIQYIKPEKDGAAIQNILYAWRAEERNRGLLKKVLSGAGVFF